VISTPDRSKPAIAPAAPPVRLGAKSRIDPKSAKLANEQLGTRQDPTLRSRREQPQCWAADATGAPRLVDCPEIGPPSDAAARPTDGYLHLPRHPQH
jgi:hypothetical protein